MGIHHLAMTVGPAELSTGVPPDLRPLKRCHRGLDLVEAGDIGLEAGQQLSSPGPDMQKPWLAVSGKTVLGIRDRVLLLIYKKFIFNAVF